MVLNIYERRNCDGISYRTHVDLLQGEGILDHLSGPDLAYGTGGKRRHFKRKLFA